MKIIYGVAGEGMGHAIRSSVIIEHLINQGHDVHIVSSGRAAKFLKQKYGKTLKVTGLVIAYKNNRVSKFHTVLANAKSTKKAVRGIKELSKFFKKVKPDLVVTDFESSTHIFAKIKGIPVISIDNIQVINRCKTDPELKTINYKIAKTIVRTMVPKCNIYMISSFFDVQVKKKNTFMYPPILRTQILEAKDKYKEKEHILVYQTSNSSDNIIDSLKKQGEHFYVYGFMRDIKEDVIDGNVTHRPFSEQRFIRDMASSKAVISGGSFTVMSECIHLHKPLLSVPVEGQFEQEMNAFHLEKRGYGKSSKYIDELILNDFIKSIDFYKDNLSEYVHDNNQTIFNDIDIFIDDLGRKGGKTNKV